MLHITGKAYLGFEVLKNDTANQNESIATGISLTTISTCLFVIVAVLSFLYSGQQIVVAQTPDANYLHAASSEKSLPIHILLVQGKSYFDRSGILHITGEVQNNFGFPVQSVQVTATLYGSQKNVIDRKSAYAYIDQLKSGGGRSGFNIIVPANVTKNSTGYSLSATSYTKSSAAAALSPKPASLNLNLNKGTKDLNGNYHLLGNVTNKGNNTATHVRV
ncbi:MAG TPA: FxLYD domain-containing protein, partial [Nitrososphaeraceae archaeon]|nr:FxLYD domain-containing protein [Nitrososphaeraceae archaeon]